jgi:asparagine synthase (glutamine-hydrolysing)
MTAILAKFRLSDPDPGKQARVIEPRAGQAGQGPDVSPAVFDLGDAVVLATGSPRIDRGSRFNSVIAASIVANYKERGAGCLMDLRGPFALAVFLRDSRRALIAVDRMGIERLAWSLDDGVLVIGSSAIEVAALGNSASQLDSQALFNFMLGHMVPSPDTVFKGVQKLMPATGMEFNDRCSKLFRYWEPGFDRSHGPQIDEVREAVLPTLKQAIERLQPDAHTGAFLSGGLDSSTVTGLLGEVTQGPPDAFSVGFGIQDFDELAYARTASRHFECRHHEYEVTADDIVEIIPLVASSFDEPFGNSSAVPTYACATLAKNRGMSHLLAGDGGDELFGGNERYVRHRIFEQYELLPSLLRQKFLSPLAHSLHPERAIFPLRKFSSYVRQAEIPLPDRFESWNLVYREGPGRVFDSDFLATVDPEQPLNLMRETWASCPSTDILDRMLWYDWKFTLADNDLRKVKTMCEAADMRVSFPMLDEDFVDLSISVPSAHKIRGRSLRHFFREAVSDYLPSDILQKDKHGFGLPFGQWLKVHSGLQSLVYGSIDNLSKRSIFRKDFLGRVIDEHRTGHASYYGYAIWDLVLLEQWLITNEERQSSSG